MCPTRGEARPFPERALDSSLACSRDLASPEIHTIIDHLQYLPDGHTPRDPRSPALWGKKTGSTRAMPMIDANQVWDVQEVIEYVVSLEEIKPCECFRPLQFNWGLERQF